MVMRKEIEDFANAMDKKMAVHDAERGDSWKHCDESYLLMRLYGEVDELKEAFQADAITRREIAIEFVDIANFCMMLHNRLNGGNQQ